MCLITDILNTKEKSEFPTFAPLGAYINGFFLEGAAWELGRGGEQGYLTDQILKELHPELPVIHVTSIRLHERREAKGNYECPVYVTTFRGPTYVFLSTLRSKDPTSKWVLAGCALVLQEDD